MRGPVWPLQLASRPVRLFDQFSALAEYRARDASMVIHRERLPEICRSVEAPRGDCQSTR